MHEELFTVGDIPAVLWTPDSDTPGDRPLILIGHGGGHHKKAPDVVARAHRFVTDGGHAVASIDVPGHGDRPPHPEYARIAAANQARADAGEDRSALIAEFQATVARQTVPEWQAVLDHLGAHTVGYWGISLGCGLGVPFVAAEPRVRAAVLGLGGGRPAIAAATTITVPVQFFLQWDDERVPRAQSLALFDALASTEKTLHANPGPHTEPPPFELDANLEFFARHLRT